MTHIYVEGPSDKVFIAAVLQQCLGLEPLFVKNDETFSFSNGRIKEIKGVDTLKSDKNEFQIDKDRGDKILLIVDADDPVKHQAKNGGFWARCQYLEDFKKSIGIDFSYFLLPNHADDGDLETLLFGLINEKNKAIFECWEGFENCLQSIQIEGRETPLTLPEPKSKIEMYMSVLLGESRSQQKKGEEKHRDYSNTEHWNLGHSSINPLVEFLKKHLIVPTL